MSTGLLVEAIAWSNLLVEATGLSTGLLVEATA